MAKNIIIFGAGASVESGAPLMQDFYEKSTSIVEKIGEEKFDNMYGDSYQLVESIRHKFQQMHHKININYDNIEELLGLVELGVMLDNIEFNNYNQDDIRKRVRHFIARTIEKSTNFPIDKNEGVIGPSPYNYLANYLSLALSKKDNIKINNYLSMFTFNYDLALDVSLNYKIPFQYGGLDEEKNDKKMSLYKMHGSLNFMYCPKCNYITYYPIGEILEKQYPSYKLTLQNRIKMDDSDRENNKNQTINIEIANRLNFASKTCPKSCSGTLHENFIIPPSWNKSQYFNLIQNIWKKGAKEMSEAEAIFIIGYSLPETDMFFRHFMGIGTIGEKSIRKFHVYNPDKGVDRKFQEIIGTGVRSKYMFKPVEFNKDVVTEIVSNLV